MLDNINVILIFFITFLHKKTNNRNFNAQNNKKICYKLLKIMKYMEECISGEFNIIRKIKYI